MSVEAKRGCGYRKIGGLYLVGGGIGVPCDRLPLPLTVCPTCGNGIKQARGWTWVDIAQLFGGQHNPCTDGPFCPLCHNPASMGRGGLLWIGEQFYKTPGEFIAEGMAQGFSRRIHSVPRGFEIGTTYVLLAHSKAVKSIRPVHDANQPVLDESLVQMETVYTPGIFYLWLPQRFEKIMVESARGSEEVADLEKRGIIPVFVPDNDKDHQPKKEEENE